MLSFRLDFLENRSLALHVPFSDTRPRNDRNI